ncbi:MAG: hypothetical protein WCR20_15915, partial [Verrucomicrobiota bacterium]
MQEHTEQQPTTNSNPGGTAPGPTGMEDKVQAAIEMLESLSSNRTLLSQMPLEQRKRLLEAAGRGMW